MRERREKPKEKRERKKGKKERERERRKREREKWNNIWCCRSSIDFLFFFIHASPKVGWMREK